MTLNYSFLVIENAEDVCEGIIERMKPFADWRSIGYCMGVKQAIATVSAQRPDLIFLDWSLNGGSAYDVLHCIQSIDGYQPFIIFNTGYQQDHPEIPQEIVNRYRVDKYLVKPYWEHLRNHLPQYLEEARQRAALNELERFKRFKVWLRSKDGTQVRMDLKLLKCIVRSPEDPRVKNYYFAGRTEPLSIVQTWSECTELLVRYRIDFFQANARAYLLTRQYLERYAKPYAIVQGLSLRFEVTREALRDFESWLKLT